VQSDTDRQSVFQNGIVLAMDAQQVGALGTFQSKDLSHCQRRRIDGLGRMIVAHDLFATDKVLFPGKERERNLSDQTGMKAMILNDIPEPAPLARPFTVAFTRQ
jgi:hypothetical protein